MSEIEKLKSETNAVINRVHERLDRISGVQNRLADVSSVAVIIASLSLLMSLVLLAVVLAC